MTRIGGMGRRVLLALLVVGCAGSADRAEEGLPRASVDGTEHYALTARHIDQTFSILPALMHDVHTRIRRELLPCFTRTFWMFGSQRRLERLWEKLTLFP